MIAPLGGLAGEAVDRGAVAHALGERVAVGLDVVGLAGQLQAPLEQARARDHPGLVEDVRDLAGARALGDVDRDGLAALAVAGEGLEEGDQEPDQQDPQRAPWPSAAKRRRPVVRPSGGRAAARPRRLAAARDAVAKGLAAARRGGRTSAAWSGGGRGMLGGRRRRLGALGGRRRRLGLGLALALLAEAAGDALDFSFFGRPPLRRISRSRRRRSRSSTAGSSRPNSSVSGFSSPLEGGVRLPSASTSHSSRSEPSAPHPRGTRDRTRAGGRRRASPRRPAHPGVRSGRPSCVVRRSS